MYTNQLQCFVSLASTLNYVKTADQLGLTQPAVSKQIQALEQELGARLFFRTTRSVSLTQEGQQFLPNAISILNTYYKSKEQIRGITQGSRRVLRIGYIDPHSINMISKVLKELLQSDQHIAPELSYAQTDANLARLIHGQLDLIVSMKDSKFADDEISFTKLRDEGFCCVLSKDHPLARKKAADPSFDGRISTEELWPYRQIISIPPYLLQTHFSRGTKIVPANDEIDNIICSNTNEAYGLVIAGTGYAYIPPHLLLDHPDLLFWEWIETPRAPLGIYHRRTETGACAADVQLFIEIALRVYQRFL